MLLISILESKIIKLKALLISISEIYSNLNLESGNSSSTSDEGDVEFAQGDDEDSAGEIRARSKVQRASMVVEVGEPRSERSTGDVVLDQPILCMWISFLDVGG
ncbi:hypothetical protein ACFX2J_034572 [Malus domestica]